MLINLVTCVFIWCWCWSWSTHVVEPPECVPQELHTEYFKLKEVVSTLPEGWGETELQIICALVDTESGWHADAKNEFGKVSGLGQLTSWWLKSSALEEYRLNDTYEQRNLFCAEDNLLTVVELLRYYYAQYGDDWHSILTSYTTGSKRGESKYSRLVLSRSTSSRYKEKERRILCKCKNALKHYLI